MRSNAGAATWRAGGRWSAGDTHFVQTGDIPDRGPDTRRIMDHLEKVSAGHYNINLRLSA